jgi:hypothetical protein
MIPEFVDWVGGAAGYLVLGTATYVGYAPRRYRKSYQTHKDHWEHERRRKDSYQFRDTGPVCRCADFIQQGIKWEKWVDKESRGDASFESFFIGLAWPVTSVVLLVRNTSKALVATGRGVAHPINALAFRKVEKEAALRRLELDMAAEEKKRAEDEEREKREIKKKKISDAQTRATRENQSDAEIIAKMYEIALGHPQVDLTKPPKRST